MKRMGKKMLIFEIQMSGKIKIHVTIFRDTVCFVYLYFAVFIVVKLSFVVGSILMNFVPNYACFFFVYTGKKKIQK